ncbi:MAG TPA: hypothetical protein VKA15_01715, partial [Isosphaeraceae bacterium]|nr:hypothetical protein [Isosphaeraceae bacterium]
MMNREQWEKFKRLGRALSPWVRPGSYRPLVLLVVIILAVILAPLAADVGWAILFGLPPWARNSLGQGMLLTLIGIGLWRLQRVKATDSWPIEPLGAEEGEQSVAARLLPWALRLAV